MTRRSPPDVMGLETELGVQSSKLLDTGRIHIETNLSKIAFNDKSINGHMDFWLTNGGRIYLDQSMWEICTPEVRTLKDFLTWQRAMERIIVRSVETNPNLTVYKNNLDYSSDPKVEESTWGSHMNYTTVIPTSKRGNLILPAVLEKLLSGSGNLRTSGEFNISQRAKKIRSIHSNLCPETHPEASMPEQRISLLDPKSEHFNGNTFESLFHHTSNDSNMLDSAEWLKTGFMRNMIALAENGCLPDMDYASSCALKDLVHVTTIPHIRTDPKIISSNWYLPSMPLEDRSALTLLRRYNDRARSVLSGIDSETDFTIDLTEEVITGLERFGEEPALLYGVLDWVTKRYLLTEKMRSEYLSSNNDEVQSVNLEYHSLNRNSLFSDLKDYGGFRTLTTEEEIRNAIINPPTNTRAYARGKIIEQALSGIATNIDNISWERIILNNNRNSEAHIKMPDARNNYAGNLSEWLSQIRLLKLKT